MHRIGLKTYLIFAGISALAVFIFIGGYLGGRARLLGRLRDASKLLISNTNANIPPGPPSDVGESQEYAELNNLLDARLSAQHQETMYWTELLETNNINEQLLIKNKLQTEFLKFLTPWPGPRTYQEPKKEFWFSKDGITAYLIKQETHPDVHLTSLLLVPDEITLPAPALLLLHGYGGNLNSIISDIDYHHGFGFDLAKKGFIILAPLRIATTVDTRNTLYLKSLASGWNLEAIELHQLVQLVDYLYALNEVDSDHVGVYGISLGGQHALRLSALDSRLSLTISSGYFADRFSWLLMRESASAASQVSEEMMQFISPLDNVLFEPSMGFLFSDLNLIALLQPRFLGIEIGTEDPRYESAMTEYEKVALLYEHVGQSERTSFLPFNGGHEVSVQNVLPFLEQWLNEPVLD